MTKRGFTVLGIGLGISSVALDWSIVATALPTIQLDLHAKTSELQWIMNTFGIFSTTFMVTMGRLADDFGRKGFFLTGLIIFLIGLALGGSAPNTGILILDRAIQGIATVILIPASQSLIRLLYPAKEVPEGLSIWSSMVDLFLALGPVIGGIIISILNWRWVFYITIPVIIASFIIGIFTLPMQKEKSSAKNIDWRGLIFLIICVGSLSLAITEGPNWGWSSYITISFFILSILALTILIFIERKVQFPIIPSKFFANRNFFGGVISAFLIGTLGWTVFL